MLDAVNNCAHLLLFAELAAELVSQLVLVEATLVLFVDERALGVTQRRAHGVHLAPVLLARLLQAILQPTYVRHVSVRPQKLTATPRIPTARSQRKQNLLLASK